jgi:5-methylcytosine-specific restriction endonuclease McrA
MYNPEKKHMPRKQIPKSVRIMVWKTYIGTHYSALCQCCWINGIDVFNFHAGHIVPSSRHGSDGIDNLRPICSNCNLSMGNQNMVDFQRQYGYTAPPFYWILKTLGFY